MQAGFWGYYVVGWIPYVAALVTVFVVNGVPVQRAVVGAIEYAAPAALLGVAVFPWCRRLPWIHGRRTRFVSLHVGAAVVFALLATGGAVALMSLERLRAVHLSFAVLRFHFNTNLLAYAALMGFAYAVEHARRLIEEQQRRVESELLRVRAELQAVRSHLNPHFLFNAIHSLIALTRQNPTAAATGLEQLGALLRYSLREIRSEESIVLVRDEWNFTSDYLALERLRLEARLQVETVIDPQALNELTVPFLLQPLVENAVRHAVAIRASGGRVRIAVRATARAVTFEVSDDGPGADPAAVEGSTGLGLRSVRERVASAYGTRGGLAIATSPGRGFAAVVTVPRSNPWVGAA